MVCELYLNKAITKKQNHVSSYLEALFQWLFTEEILERSLSTSLHLEACFSQNLLPRRLLLRNPATTAPGPQLYINLLPASTSSKQRHTCPTFHSHPLQGNK